MRNKVWDLVVLALLLVLCACGGPSGPTWQEQYDLGVRYLSEGNYEEAILAFTAAIEIDPKRAEAYVGRGDAYVLSGETGDDLTAAQADYEKAIELDGTNADAYRGLADVYIRLGDHDKALEILEQGIDDTGDRDLQVYLDELRERYPEDPQDMITATGSIFMGSTDETYDRYNEEHDLRVGLRMYGIRFESPVSVQIDGHMITLQEAEADNLEEHFDADSQLFDFTTYTVGPMVERRMRLTGYIYRRDPAGELTPIEDGDDPDLVDYIYHPYGDYAFYIVSYESLD